MTNILNLLLMLLKEVCDARLGESDLITPVKRPPKPRITTYRKKEEKGKTAEDNNYDCR